MENEILRGERNVSPGAVRSAERAVEARYSAYLEEAQRLIRAGIAEIRERGNVDPRVSDIVRRAGLSNKAFYRHFRSKEELLLAVLEEGMQLRVAEFERRLAAAPNARERIRRWIWGVLEQAMVPELAEATRPLLVYQARLAESLGEQLWGHADRLAAPLRAALEEARESGELPDVEPEAHTDVVYYLAMGWMHGRVIAKRLATEDEARRVVAFAMRALGAGD